VDAIAFLIAARCALVARQRFTTPAATSQAATTCHRHHLPACCAPHRHHRALPPPACFHRAERGLTFAALTRVCRGDMKTFRCWAWPGFAHPRQSATAFSDVTVGLMRKRWV